MKVDIGNESKKEKYPYIGKHDSIDLIVLFTSHDEGVCLHSTDEGSKVGEYSDIWDENNFNVYGKTITLSND